MVEASFSTLSMSIFSSALMSLGEIANPQSGKKDKDLPMAQFNIDLLIVLREKTRNNLSKEEADMLGQMINDLQMKYLHQQKNNS